MTNVWVTTPNWGKEPSAAKEGDLLVRQPAVSMTPGSLTNIKAGLGWGDPDARYPHGAWQTLHVPRSAKGKAYVVRVPNVSAQPDTATKKSLGIVNLTTSAAVGDVVIKWGSWPIFNAVIRGNTDVIAGHAIKDVYNLHLNVLHTIVQNTWKQAGDTSWWEAAFKHLPQGTVSQIGGGLLMPTPQETIIFVLATAALKADKTIHFKFVDMEGTYTPSTGPALRGTAEIYQRRAGAWVKTTTGRMGPAQRTAVADLTPAGDYNLYVWDGSAWKPGPVELWVESSGIWRKP